MSADIQKNSPTLVEMPPELVSQIVMVKNFKGKYILDVVDVSNMRLTSRRMNAKSFHDFARRFFTVRRHVVNAASFKCLQEISQDPNFSSYVREVSFVPMRINYPLQDTHSWPLQEWYPVFGHTYQALIQEQEAFDRSKDNSRMITEALSAFPDLEKVRIEAYPCKIYDSGWTEAWGAKTILRKTGVTPDPEENAWRRVRGILMDQQGQDPANICAHYEIVLDALGSLSKRENSQKWTLDIALLIHCGDDRRQLFDLSSQNFLRIRDRIESVYLNTMGIDDLVWHIDEIWLRKYLEVCPGIVSLTLDQDSEPDEFLLQLRLDNLRRFELLSCRVSSESVGRFLKTHSNTLESIRIRLVQLRDGLNSTAVSSWFGIFETMMRMPHLNAIDLCRLAAFMDASKNYELEHIKVLHSRV